MSAFISNVQDFDYSSMSLSKMQDFDYSNTFSSLNFPSMDSYTSGITKAQLELAWNIAAYSAIMWHHTRRTAPTYKKDFQQGSVWPLAIHITSGIFEVFRLHIRSLYGPVYPDLLDLAAAFAQSITNLILVKPLRRGQPSLTRPSYQAGGILRPIVSSIAYATQNPALHRGSVKMVNAFVYTRMDIWILVNLNIVKSYATIYAFAVTHGAMQAIYEGTGLTGLSIYTGLIVALMLVERVVSNFISDNEEDLQHDADEEHTKPISQVHNNSSKLLQAADHVTHLGFAELHTVQRHNTRKHGPSTQIDDYVSPHLSVM
ncbi:hypothetical protein K431DRAFT_282598 [Polychaeton citri CBS 116435]|uniref:Uncharacterized protein n=1 Tax=Polychaeton citri CBS 116435 TaxID=1314669 RepID=A0A9P4QCY8_9PEZI|nr:hypothetical protein K431DRAFT_282598 [Polychaeton citri CBS 116435]